MKKWAEISLSPTEDRGVLKDLCVSGDAVTLPTNIARPAEVVVSSPPYQPRGKVAGLESKP